VTPTLVELSLADPPSAWAELGFAVDGDTVALGGVSLTLGAPGRGIVSWSLAGVADPGYIDGLPTRVVAPGAQPVTHPNGAIGLDHVVVTTPDFDRTSAALADAGMPLRRVRDVGFRQGFRRLGPGILELVEARDAPPGPARFWGLVIVVSDLDALARRLGDRLGAIKPAVQAGRHIATLRREAGLGQAVAVMDPEL
jgi:hypothetical protein